MDKPYRFLTIVAKGLDFIYSTKYPIGPYRNYSEITMYPHVPTEEKHRKISCQVWSVDDSGKKTPVDTKILNRLREPGHYVFVHPDEVA
jgi:hypothetical protein